MTELRWIMPMSAITPSAPRSQRLAQYQGPGNVWRCPAVRNDQHGPAETVQLQHQEREGQEQHDRGLWQSTPNPCCFSTAPATAIMVARHCCAIGLPALSAAAVVAVTHRVSRIFGDVLNSDGVVTVFTSGSGARKTQTLTTFLTVGA
jgi:hypothetical protein